jgi:CRISPR-associated protein Csb1
MLELRSMSTATADNLLASALANAERVAGVTWNGVVLHVTGNPAIVSGAIDEDTELGDE